LATAPRANAIDLGGGLRPLDEDEIARFLFEFAPSISDPT